MLAAGLSLGDAASTALIALLGAGCDGELTLDEVLGRIAALAARAAPGSAARASAPAHADELERAASGIRHRGEHAGRPLRPRRARRGRDPRRAPHGRRSGPLGALGFYFDLEAAAAELPLAAAVADSERLEEAREAPERARRLDRARLRARPLSGSET